MTSHFSNGLRVLTSYAERSMTQIRRNVQEAVDFDALSWKRELPLYSFKKLIGLQDWIVGCDADIGGKSEAYWGQTRNNTALFWGTLSTEIPDGLKIMKSGYAGIRSKELPLTCLRYPRHNVDKFRYLHIRAKGDTRQWFVNIQCDSLHPTWLYQHRLFFKKIGEWEEIKIPFRDFILTAGGYVQKRQVSMDRTRIRTIGFSILRQPGKFELELDWIKAINTNATYGDMDLLDEGEYVDKRGILRKVYKAEDLQERVRESERLRPFHEPKKL